MRQWQIIYIKLARIRRIMRNARRPLYHLYSAHSSFPSRHVPSKAAISRVGMAICVISAAKAEIFELEMHTRRVVSVDSGRHTLMKRRCRPELIAHQPGACWRREEAARHLRARINKMR